MFVPVLYFVSLDLVI